MTQAREARHAEGVARRYRTEAIEVAWEPRLCIHEAACIRGLPEVFDPSDRPWIHVEAADPDRIADVVMTCPTGALRFARFDGGSQEEDRSGPVEVRVTPNGPLHVRGVAELRDADGEPVRTVVRAALCGCGGSRNKPYCDGTHRLTGFRG